MKSAITLPIKKNAKTVSNVPTSEAVRTRKVPPAQTMPARSAIRSPRFCGIGTPILPPKIVTRPARPRTRASARAFVKCRFSSKTSRSVLQTGVT